jgi:hypothetical protein
VTLRVWRCEAGGGAGPAGLLPRDGSGVEGTRYTMRTATSCAVTTTRPRCECQLWKFCNCVWDEGSGFHTRCRLEPAALVSPAVSYRIYVSTAATHMEASFSIQPCAPKPCKSRCRASRILRPFAPSPAAQLHCYNYTSPTGRAAGRLFLRRSFLPRPPRAFPAHGFQVTLRLQYADSAARAHHPSRREASSPSNIEC